MARGRPSKYKPEFCDMLVKHMENGLSFESFAAVAGVNRDSLYEWSKKYVNFSDAKKKGEELGLRTLETLGLNLAAGRIQGNVTAWIFFMKNRFGWRDRRDLELTGKDGGAIKYSNLTDEELKAKKDAILKRLQD